MFLRCYILKKSTVPIYNAFQTMTMLEAVTVDFGEHD